MAELGSEKGLPELGQRVSKILMVPSGENVSRSEAAGQHFHILQLIKHRDTDACDQSAHFACTIYEQIPLITCDMPVKPVRHMFKVLEP